jgi:hypothetical protein
MERLLVPIANQHLPAFRTYMAEWKGFVTLVREEPITAADLTLVELETADAKDLWLVAVRWGAERPR